MAGTSGWGFWATPSVTVSPGRGRGCSERRGPPRDGVSLRRAEGAGEGDKGATRDKVPGGGGAAMSWGQDRNEDDTDSEAPPALQPPQGGPTTDGSARQGGSGSTAPGGRVLASLPPLGCLRGTLPGARHQMTATCLSLGPPLLFREVGVHVTHVEGAWLPSKTGSRRGQCSDGRSPRHLLLHRDLPCPPG